MLKNQNGGSILIVAMLPAVVVFISFFVVNSLVKEAGSMVRKQSKYIEAQRIIAQLAVVVSNAYQLGQRSSTCDFDPADASSPDQGLEVATVLQNTGAQTLCIPRSSEGICVSVIPDSVEKYCIRKDEGNHAITAQNKSPIPTLRFASTKKLNVADKLLRRWENLAQFWDELKVQSSNEAYALGGVGSKFGTPLRITGGDLAAFSSRIDVPDCTAAGPKHPRCVDCASDTWDCVLLEVCPYSVASGACPSAEVYMQRIAIQIGP